MKSIANFLSGAALAAPLSMALAACCAAFYWLPQSLAEAWMLSRQQPEIWQAVTAHLMHSDGRHLLWNLAGLVVLGLCFEPVLKRHVAGLLLFSASAVTIWFVFFQTRFHWYCGLSSLLNGLLAAGLIAWWQQSKDPLAVAIAALALAKIAIEHWQGAALLPTGDWQSTTMGHLVGLVSGGVYQCVRLFQSQSSKSAGNLLTWEKYDEKCG